MIDEYQDCGYTQHQIFLRLINLGLISIAVGDIDQAIYAFANKYSKYLVELINNPNFKHFVLTINHRCHRSIIDYSLCLLGVKNNEIQDDIRVFAINVEGSEKEICEKIDDLLCMIKEKYKVKNNNKVAILCKKNNTVQRVHKFLKTSHKIYNDTLLDKENSDWGRFFCDLLYSCFDETVFAVDYAEKLFSEEYAPKKYKTALSICSTIFSRDLEDFHESYDDIVKLANLYLPDKENEHSLAVLREVINDINELKNFLPAKDDEVNVMTIHKSKGLEFNIVFHMDAYDFVMPGYNCSQEGYNQDKDLHYVAITRSIDVCYIMLGSLRFRERQQDLIETKISPFLKYDGLKERRIEKNL
jgi:DNA helicase-2/ATP-dependent DNA helicase PcrA